MNEHVDKWLDKYYDGELRGMRLRQVEEHLPICTLCQSALEARAALSAILQDAELPDRGLPADQFVGNVMLRLPREQARPPLRNRIVRKSWWSFPVVLVVAWVFIQSALTVATIIGVLLRSGIFGADVFALVPNPQSTTLLGSVMNTPIGWVLVINILPAVIFGLLYLSWLASWWVNTEPDRVQESVVL